MKVWDLQPTGDHKVHNNNHQGPYGGHSPHLKDPTPTTDLPSSRGGSMGIPEPTTSIEIEGKVIKGAVAKGGRSDMDIKMGSV